MPWINLRGVTLLMIALLLLSGILSPYPAEAEPGEVIDRIVAVVNDDIITLSQLNERMAPIEKKVQEAGYISEEDRKKVFMLRNDALERLIEEKLLQQEIKKASLAISEQEVSEAIENIKKAKFLTDEQLRAALAREGLTMEVYREKLKDDILRTRLLNMKIKSKIIITKEEIEDYYNEHQDIFSGVKKYHLRNIIMKKPVFTGPKIEDEVLLKMKDLIKRLDKGESFASLATSSSESPLARKGGDLGKISPDLFSPQIQEALKGLKAGQHTGILDTDQGYQIFYIENIIESPGKTLEQASPEIEKKLYDNYLDKMLKSWLEDLRKEAHIKIIN